MMQNSDNSIIINEIAKHRISEIKLRCEEIKPLVVIWCITYNHEYYLKEALDGFLMQHTNFPFVVIVHEDLSTDGTAKILKEYADNYPEIIFPIFEQENQFSKTDGSLNSIMEVACKATGAKYVALCEGDDYWIDSNKLQRQVDFLETHPDISYTCHRYKIQINNTDLVQTAPNIFLDKDTTKEGFEFDFQYVFKSDWVTKTLTSVFRTELLGLNELKDCFFYRDVHMIYEIMSKTNGYCFQFIGGVYRKQQTGVWSQSGILKNTYTEVKTWESIYKRKPTKFNLWKIRNNYARYIYFSIQNKRLFKISNIQEVIAIFFAPIELLKMSIHYYRKNEIKRIGKLQLHKGY